jgi:hypothetical protein
VTAQVLAALQPAAVEVSLRAAEQVEADRAALEALWAKRLERAAIAVDRARRCYRLAEPENRLVVRQLEKDWEHALAAQQQLTEEHDRFARVRPARLTPAERAAIEALAADIEGLWTAETTTDKDRKELIRALVTDVTLTVQGESERVAVTIIWAGGHITEGTLARPVARFDQLSYYPQLCARLHELRAQELTSRQIADRLDAEGFRPPKRTEHFTANSVTTLLRRLQPRTRPRPVAGPDGPRKNEWWLSDLARHLAMPETTLYTWIQRGWVSARRQDGPPHHLILKADEADLAELRERRSRPHGYYTRLRWTERNLPPDGHPPATPQAAGLHL